jgi:hypothetical protein
MERRIMTDAERAEIAEIERAAKARFDTAHIKLFGVPSPAKHLRPKA